MTAKMYLALALHNHQPVGNFEFVFEEAYQKAYLPMLNALERHPHVRLAIHNTGPLLDWLFVAHPEYIERLKALVTRGQIEIMSGGYYEPILVSLPDKDKRGQIKKLTRTVKKAFDFEPTGAWLAERIWEPHLPRAMSKAGVDYTIVDDTHFRYAGLNDEDMFGYYVTEEQGHPLKIFGTAQHLRYTVPWVQPSEVISWLREQAERDLPLYTGRPRVAVMGDDGEKFGLWPGTLEHCWGDNGDGTGGWIDQFFGLLAENSDWLQTTTLGDFAREQTSLGPLYMPAASYDEMTEWALPTVASAEIVDLKHDLQARDDKQTLKFIKGGLWRGFLAKYPEVNQMHKKSLAVSAKIHGMARGKKRKAALDKLWAAQCNCGYWHGLFGGSYLFHIRGANYRNLISAEIATLEKNLTVSLTDFTRNGQPDLIIDNRTQWLCFDLSNGGALVEWDYRDAPYNLLNTMSRRPEAYHREIIEAAKAGKLVLSSQRDELTNAHEGPVFVKELGLEDKLVYDWFRRAALQDRFMHTDTTPGAHFRADGELGDFVLQPYQATIVEDKRQAEVTLTRDGGVWQDDVFQPVTVSKTVSLDRKSAQMTVSYSVTNRGDSELSTRFGIENNYGLEGGQDPLTYFEGLGDGALPGVAGQASAVTKFALVSDIITVNSKIETVLSESAEIWWFPIETVTQSENGYEPNYQGTAVLHSWLLKLAAGESWTVKLDFTLSTR